MTLIDNFSRRRRQQEAQAFGEADLEKVTSDITAEIKTIVHDDYIPPEEPPQLPDYVEHHAGIDDIGKLSAQAVVQQYETAAKAIEAMGKELIEVAHRAETMAAEVKAAIAYVEETAQKYRDEAKIIFDRIEQASLLTVEVRKTCDDLRDRINSPKHI